MSLINCPECGKEVSDKAPSCPNCGVPISGGNSDSFIGEKTFTVEKTSKKLKRGYLIAFAIVLLGFILMPIIGDEAGAAAAFFIIAVGIILIIVTKIRIWWYHE